MATPIRESRPETSARLDPNRRYRLSRYVQLRPDKEGLIAESLITGRRRFLPNAAAIRLVLSFTGSIQLSDLLSRLNRDQAPAALEFLSRCLEDGLITAVHGDRAADEDAIPSLRHWETHDLAFHVRSRRGRTSSPVGATWHLDGVVAAEPVRRHARASILAKVQLPRPDLDRLRYGDEPLTRLLERRRSRYSVHPVSLADLASLLFRACRVTRSGTVGDQDIVWKVYPSGGGLHSLEVYAVVHRCADLAPGGYRYDAFDHCLERLRDPDPDLTDLLREAQAGTAQLEDLPSVLLILASRFRRVTRKYQSLAYHVILQEVGALYQTIYLVGESLGLAVSAIGAGDSNRFAKVFGTDYFAESSVGEMIVGGAPLT